MEVTQGVHRRLIEFMGGSGRFDDGMEIIDGCVVLEWLLVKEFGMEMKGMWCLVWGDFFSE